MKKPQSTGMIPWLKPLLLGIAVSVVIAAILMSIMATMILNETVQVDYLGWIAPLMNFVVIFAGCLVYGLTTKEKLLYGLIGITAVLFLISIGITVFAFGGDFAGFAQNVIAGILGAVVAFLILISKGRKKTGAFRKVKYR